MKKVALIGGGIFLLLIIIGAASGGCKTEKVGSNTDTTQVAAAPSSQPQQDVKYKVGDQVKMGDVILTVNKLEKSQGGQFTKPSDGNEWVNLNMTIENTGSKQEFVTTLGQMYIVDADGNQYQVAVTNKAMENVNNSLDGAIVAKAKKTGWVGFEVPKTAKGITFHYKASFWNDKAILVELQ
jgi:predicted esterase YcpF (UPF0227 family)